MSSINPAALVVCVMAGSGFLVLVLAGISHFLGLNDGRDPHARTPEQDAYMRDVRRRNYEDLAAGRRALKTYRDPSHLNVDSRT